MDQLIPLINELQQVQDALHTSNNPKGNADAAPSTFIDLPRIVVIGSQSSGKSSVLEGLVQKDFLPRGKDIVTRRPLVLQLQHSRNEQGEGDWAQFGHKPDVFTDFLDVKKEIELETMRVAGHNKGISPVPIVLKIVSDKVVDLTLVDLPGITKIPVGDQPTDIEVQIKNMILEYARPTNTLILAITPANSDLTNSDALKLASEVDPSGERTLGVLTKLDLMDSGTDAASILKNEGSCQLSLGFIGVVCRSQRDINLNTPIDESLRKEREYFRHTLAYTSIRHRCGISVLGRQLNKILISTIQTQLPKLRMKLNELIVKCKNDLDVLGNMGIPAGTSFRGTLLLKLVTTFVTDFQDMIQGTCKNNLNGTAKVGGSNNFLVGGAKIGYIFNVHYRHAIESMEAAQYLDPQYIKNAIRNSSGTKPALFVPESCFEGLAKSQIGSLLKPAKDCANLVHNELLHALSLPIRRLELQRFPKLASKLVEISHRLLAERITPTLEMVESLVAIESAYINTKHPDFCYNEDGGFSVICKLVDEYRTTGEHDDEAGKGRRGSDCRLQSGNPTHTKVSRGEARTSVESPTMTNVSLSSAGNAQNEKSAENGFLSKLFNNSNSNSTKSSANSTTKEAPSHSQPQSKEDMEIKLIQTLLFSYISIVKKNLKDSIPKTIMHFLVNHLMEELPNRLVSDLYKEEIFEELLEEDQAMVRERDDCKRALEAYQRSAIKLSELQLE